ncbi:MAG: hypothetical protein D6769_03425 [Methanobacteriota archaeon]|nr:MAG: hypothetical protein D6769_03425 [Euryarchaeota archaeon]
MECIKCGKESEVGLFCVSCYVPKVKMPKKVFVEHCRGCNKYRFGGKWNIAGRREVERYLASRIKGEFKVALVDLYKKEATIVVDAKNGDVEYTMPFAVAVEETLCKECSKRRGSYYEGILQLRGNENKVEKIAREFKKLVLKKTFITNEEEMHGGYNIYVGSSRAMLEAIAKLGIKDYKLSRTLHTAKQGKRVYRITVSVRF